VSIRICPIFDTVSAIRPSLLLVDDDPLVVESLSSVLDQHWDVRAAATGREAIQSFGELSPDVVLLDVQLPDMSGIDLLQHFKVYSENVGVIMMSGAGSFDRVVESVKLGAEAFLQKPFDIEVLELTLQNVSRIIATRRSLVALQRNEGVDLENLPGVSPLIRDLNHLITQVADAPSSILIEGESGTGKGVLAKLIHRRSPRSRAPFLDLNCAGLSKELLESELFGHERGAFTNAMNMKQGLFEIAADGTLFLDEIAEMDITVQARLLKALEDKRFRRVGGLRDLSANFRLIAATNRDLAEDVSRNRFRGDLYYRLNVVNIRMPALRERLEDVPILVEVMLRPLAKEMGRPVPSLTASAMKKLQTYHWPGNVRELRNVLERALLTLSGKEIRSEDLMLESAQTIKLSPNGLPTTDWEIRPLDDVILDYINAAVKAAGGNVRKASRQLRISPSTLYARLREKAPAED
jgi:DNA-binding NtrC family response regulator